MNKLEEQLEHLNLQAELNIAKKRRGQVANSIFDIIENTHLNI